MAAIEKGLCLGTDRKRVDGRCENQDVSSKHFLRWFLKIVLLNATAEFFTDAAAFAGATDRSERTIFSAVMHLLTLSSNIKRCLGVVAAVGEVDLTRMRKIIGEYIGGER
jgi:hypothetical protein